ncbi:MAG TPA: NAD(P)-dependent oxidoreductase [Gemmatimonadaceae bacterium]|nr:NAD(P)-dependent oxidoreductase [Gemmatimonadaceae bacterium]
MTATAFLGLGAIGRPMARRLAAAFPQTVVWNRTPTVAQAFGREHGVRVAATAADAAREADIVITCLPTSQDVESVLDAGLDAALRPGTVLLDCTSGDPATSRRIAARLAARDIAFMDAPVSGGTIGAENGTLTIMCGGSETVLDRVRPVLESFGSKIVHCGEIGAGHALKSVNNALLALHVLSTAEGLVALSRAGVRADVALDVINASSGRSNASMNLFPERVITRAFPRTFRLALLDKDTRIAAGVARDERVFAPLLQLASELMTLARNELGEEADHVEAVKMIERWANVEIR